jgi:tetratricopeptide (TPR) repeat protein
MATARAADPEPTRDQLRQLWSEPDLKAQHQPLFQLAREADPHGWPPASLILLASALDSAGEQEAAADLLRHAQVEHPGDVWVNYNLADLLGRVHPPQADEAIRFYSVARALRPETAHSMAHALKRRGRGDEAAAVFRDLTTLRPDDGRHWSCLCALLEDRGDHKGAKQALEKAVSILRAAIRLKSDDTFSRNLLGLVLCDGAHDYPAAEAEFQEAIRLNPGEALTHYNLGVALRGQGKAAAAASAYREAIRLDPSYSDAHDGLGNALRDEGKVAEAIAAYREAIRLDPDDSSHHHSLGAVLCDAAHDYPAAVAEFRAAIRLQPGDVVAHCNLGTALSAQGKTSEAIAAYREAIRLDPNGAIAHIHLGATLCDVVHDYAAAIAEFHEAIRLKPDDAEAHRNLGIALRDQGNLDESIAAFRTAIRLKPDYAEAHYNMGLALAKQGKLSDVAAAYREAIRIKPNYAEAHCNLGSVLTRQGQLVEALFEYRRGHELGSKQPGWSYPSAEWVRRAERLVELEYRFPAVIRGDDKLKDAVEQLEFARFASKTQHFGPAARLFFESFRADPSLAEDTQAANRYNAACSAVLAAAGKGTDKPPPGEPEKARWRQQALEWLRADLAHWAKQVETGKPDAKVVVSEKLGRWQADTDLGSIRDRGELAQLPEKDQAEWRALWAEVEALLKQAQSAAR